MNLMGSLLGMLRATNGENNHIKYYPEEQYIQWVSFQDQNRIKKEIFDLNILAVSIYLTGTVVYYILCKHRLYFNRLLKILILKVIGSHECVSVLSFFRKSCLPD